jgi:hypothetical protein
MLHNPYVTMLAAALAAWIFGAVWYGALSKPYQRALGLDPEDCKGKKMPIAPMVTSFVAEIVMAFVMGGILPFSQMGWTAGTGAGLLLGIGFMATSTLVNNMFQQRKPMLSVIDGAHWILVAAIEGAVLAALS